MSQIKVIVDARGLRFSPLEKFRFLPSLIEQLSIFKQVTLSYPEFLVVFEGSTGQPQMLLQVQGQEGRPWEDTLIQGKEQWLWRDTPRPR